MSDTASSSRREFLRATGASLAAAPFLSPAAAAAQQRSGPPPAKTFGYAIVGLGGLSLSDILPAFAHTTRSRVTGLVSGDLEDRKSVV